MLRSTKAVEPSDFTEMFLKQSPCTVYDACTSEFQEIISLEDFTDLVNAFRKDINKLEPLHHNLLAPNQQQFIWIDEKGEKAVNVIFNEDHVIQRLVLRPFIQYKDTDAKLTRNTYAMPIQDKWYVFWGGTNEFLNYHYLYEQQRYAYDLVLVRKGQTFKQNPYENENYFAFNKEVAAPLQGEVIKVVNNVVDNLPGEMNESEPLGNYVVIKHENNEYSLLAHLKEESITVKETDIVKTGQKIGQCGNSGNSSEPHIHFQVMDTYDIWSCTSLNIKFKGVSPVQGEYVYPDPI